jgi:4-hydroxyphenylacetate 3-monooxygenase
MGSSSLMATPCEVDFSNPIAADVEQYFQVAHLASQGRVALFRLAQDVAVSGFGSRQSLYERFFFGPPNLMAAVYFDLYNKDDMIERVDELLKRDDASQGLQWL